MRMVSSTIEIPKGQINVAKIDGLVKSDLKVAK